jgi:peptidoglycan/xylan/chitin deacetylase (PgdA/CDA1 family)
MFHGISSHKINFLPPDVQPRFSSAELDSTLHWLKAHFSFLSPREFFETRKPGILITFDDGFANNEANALPVLEYHQAPAVFFVTTQHIIDPHNWLPATRRMVRKHWRAESDVDEMIAVDFFNGMTVEQLRRCADHPLLTIGSHTLSHPFLTQCDSSSLTFELCESKKLLESLTQKSVDLFAYPTGDYNDSVMDAAKQVGYRAAFVMDSQKLGSPAYEIPRIGLYDADPIYLALKLSGLHRPPLSKSRILKSMPA